MTPAGASLRDWRTESTASISACLAAEYRWWSEALGWDLESAWTAVEPARTRGDLPGLVYHDSRTGASGWCFFLRHGDALQVASFTASSVGATEALLDRMLASPEAAGAALAVSFTRGEAPGLADGLAARGFAVERYHYLAASTAGFINGTPRLVTTPAPWLANRANEVATLVARAYAPATNVRPFAPRGRPDEWTEYIAALVGTAACGRFLPDASAMIPGAGPGMLDGAVIVTAIGPETAHVAQVAVDPAAEGRGLATALVSQGGAAAGALGFGTLTLLVGDANNRAAALYARLGFRPRAAFLAAVRR